ncbi:hypothetical protein L1987_57386 [Smallanthus sonchifolius]|uniref:Uncharacterized protein n=1 Tax=Smallanthus sonchifolius TaxID=185202 RepID=A0ACB9DCF0_9ASTR|nr:hypothetical protein L1987_57386 [Smallanthus sonchifolius]
MPDLTGFFTADDEAAKQSTTVWINRPRYILEQQDENYFCWKHDFGNPANSVPVWLVNSTSHGTGVFIPRTRKGNKPSRRWKGRGRKYNRVVD